MRIVSILAGLALVSVAAAQRPIRIPVRHADPYAIKAMMEGKPIISPELSTLLLLMNQPGAAAALSTGANLLMDGKLFVNPTDNSLWWYRSPI